MGAENLLRDKSSLEKSSNGKIGENEKVPYMDLITNVNKFLGLYPVDRKASPLVKAAFYIWRYAILVWLVIFAIQSSIAFNRSEKSFADKSLGLLQALLFLAATCKNIYFIVRQEQVTRFVKTMKNTFRDKSEDLLEPVEMMYYHRITVIMCYIAWMVFFSGAITITLTAVAFRSSLGYILPFDAWYPWNTEEKLYTPTYLSQILDNLIMAYSFCGVDLFYDCVVLYAAGQWEVLGSNMKNMIYTALLRFGLPSNQVKAFAKCYNAHGAYQSNHSKVLEKKLIKVIRTEEFEKVLKQVMKETIQFHKNLLDFSDAMEDFFTWYCIFIIGSGIFYTIFIIFTMMVSNSLYVNIGQTTYFLNAVMQMFLLTTIGNLLISSSEDLLQSFYEAPWYLCRNDLQKQFLFIFQRISKGKLLTAGKIIVIRREVFIFVMRISFSVYTLLKDTLVH